MRRYSTFIIIGCAFVAVSALLYYFHYFIFRDTHHIFIYMVGDLAFLPLEVFLVVIVIERILARREKQSIMHKLNMVIGAFFSEVGNHLLHTLFMCSGRDNEVCRQFNIDQNWTHEDFKRSILLAGRAEHISNYSDIDLMELKTFLVQKRTFLLRLLENPNLLEHGSFTDLLWATFHLTEELEARPTFESLPETDRNHLAVDIQRAHRHLIIQWILYVEHLKSNYPFLFSMIVRTNPFLEHASAVVT